jgi:sugar phosphate permease
MAILVYLRVRNTPQDMGLPPLHHLPGGEQETGSGLFAGMKQVATARRFWPISFYTFFAVGLSLALGALWGGPYLMQVHGMSKTAAGGILSSFAVAMILGSPVLAFLSNRLGRKPVLIGSSICFAAVCGAFTLWVDSLSSTMLIVLFFCAGFVGVSTGNVVATVSKELFPHKIAGTAVGLVNLFPFFGGALFQIVMGAIVSFETRTGMADLVSGYRMMFLFVLTCAAANVAISFFVTETYRRS